MIPRREFLKVAGSSVALASGACLFAADALSSNTKKRNLPKAVMYATLGVKGSVLEQFKALKEAGFDGVELMSHMNQAEVLRALKETGLKAASVCCSTHWEKPLSAPDPAAREAGLQGVKQTLRDAKAYGATAILLVPGVVKKGVTYDECFQRTVAETRKLIPLAEELGVKIGIENVWNNFLMKPEQAVQFLDAVNSPQVGWYFDLGNMIKFTPAEQWIALLGKRIVRLHFKEYSIAKGFSVPFLEGDNHWPAIMKALDEIGYNSWATTEQPNEQAKDVASLKELSSRLDRILAS